MISVDKWRSYPQIFELGGALAPLLFEEKIFVGRIGPAEFIGQIIVHGVMVRRRDNGVSFAIDNFVSARSAALEVDAYKGYGTAEHLALSNCDPELIVWGLTMHGVPFGVQPLAILAMQLAKRVASANEVFGSFEVSRVVCRADRHTAAATLSRHGAVHYVLNVSISQ